MNELTWWAGGVVMTSAMVSEIADIGHPAGTPEPPRAGPPGGSPDGTHGPGTDIAWRPCTR